MDEEYFLTEEQRVQLEVEKAKEKKSKETRKAKVARAVRLQSFWRKRLPNSDLQEGKPMSLSCIGCH